MKKSLKLFNNKGKKPKRHGGTRDFDEELEDEYEEEYVEDEDFYVEDGYEDEDEWFKIYGDRDLVENVTICGGMGTVLFPKKTT